MGMTCDPAEIRQVKAELDANPRDLGLGVIHLPTGRLHLRSFDSVGRRGHEALVSRLGYVAADCRGFVIVKDGPSFHVLNVSQLNGPQGRPGSLNMADDLFNNIVKELRHGGL